MSHLIQRFSAIAIFVTLAATAVSAQTARLYSSESGLSNSQINDIYQDRKGFIWISTENGLTRFNGTDFTTFRLDSENPNSIASNLVLTTLEDNAGTLWVGTSSGLQTFDRDLNCFRRVDLEDSRQPESDQHISALLEIRGKDKELILAASSGRGIYVMDMETHRIQHGIQELLDKALPSQFIGRLYLDSDQRLWIASENGGIALISPLEGKQLTDIWDRSLRNIASDVNVNAFLEYGDKVILGTYNHGILIYDKAKGKIRQTADQMARSCRVMALLKNNCIPGSCDHSILVGVENGGVRLFDMDTETLKKADLPRVPYNTETWKVHCFLEDTQGNLWVGAFQKGVLVLPKSMYGFEFLNPGKDQGKEDIACVSSVVVDGNKGDLWIATDGDGLYQKRADGKTMNWVSSNCGLSNNSIISLCIDRRGTLWIATYLDGLYRRQPNGAFTRFRGQAGFNTPKTVALAYSEDEDLLYMGTHGNGLFVIDAAQERIIRTLSEDDNKWISSLYLDSSGVLWVGTYNGPMCYDHKTRKLIKYAISEDLTAHVLCFCESADGKMWIGTGGGLFSFERASGTVASYTEADGLPSNVVAAIQESQDGSLWIATQNGLSKMDPAKGEFRNYYHYDGLQGNEFHANASFKARDGKLYFGGNSGLTSFYPHIVNQRTHPVPPLYFSELTVMNREVEYDPGLGKGNVLDKNITEASRMTLPYGENIFSIKFSVLEYTNPNKISYSYMLDGFDGGWHHLKPGARTATYTNLPSGRYRMKVKAYFDGEPHNYSYREIGIRILPPWYGSWWAFLIYAASAALAVAGAARWLKKQRKAKKDREESEIKELKLRMFTNISHEIRTPLTLVMSPLKKLREAESDPKVKDLYNLMYRNSLRILRLVNQLLDMRKIDNGQMQMHFVETDLTYFIGDIMQSFGNLAVSREIDFRMNSEREVEKIWIDQGNFDKVIFNILSNAFKFTPDKGEIRIDISAPRPNNGILGADIREYVEIIVENSGSSIEEKNLGKVFDRFFQVNVLDAKEGSGVGLNLAKMLVELHHGDIRAYNTEKGIAFAMRIPAGCAHLTEAELSASSKHKDLYAKTNDLLTSREDVTDAPQHVDGETASQTRSKRSIILVDDDDELRAYLKLELQAYYNVESFAGAKEAWGTISTTVPDAVVTDLMMPGMDGVELCTKIRKNPGTNHIPVIILTSSGDEQSIGRCIDSGADRFFTKPISLEILKSAIANAISTRETMKNKFSKDLDYGYAEVDMPNSGNHFAEKVIRIIKDNIDNSDFGVGDLSLEVGMSRVHLNRKLKETMNISPSNLIKSIRLKQAAYLLINHKVNISEVAYRVGFSTHSYFSNSFHEYFGMTPKEFVAKYMDCKDEEALKKIFG